MTESLLGGTVDGTAGLDPERPRGRNRITSRALNRLVCAVTADELHVSASGVSADLADSAGLLTLIVRTPIRTVSLGDVSNDPTIVSRTGGTVLQRAAAGQAGIRARVTELTGAQVVQVVVQLTRPDIQREARVR